MIVRDDIETGYWLKRARVLERVGLVGDALSDHVELALEGVALEPVGGRDEALTVHRLGRQHLLAEAGIVDRHVAPAEEALALLDADALDEVADDAAPFGVLGHEPLPDAITPGLRQVDALLGADRVEEVVRDLDEESRPVADQRIGAGGAAMGEVLEDLQPVLDHAAGLHALHVGDEADAASIALPVGAVEALGQGHVRIARAFDQATIRDQRRRGAPRGRSV